MSRTHFWSTEREIAELPANFTVLEGQSNHAQYRSELTEVLSSIGLQALLDSPQNAIDRDAVEQATKAVHRHVGSGWSTSFRHRRWDSENVHGQLGLAIGLIYSSVSSSIALSLMNDRPKHPSELMKSLDIRFAEPKSRLIELALCRMFSVKLDSHWNDINKYYSKILGEKSKLEALGLEVDDEAVQHALLAGLPRQYDILLDKWAAVSAKDPNNGTDQLMHDLLSRQAEIPYEAAMQHAMLTLKRLRAGPVSGKLSPASEADGTASETEGALTPLTIDFAPAGYA